MKPKDKNRFRKIYPFIRRKPSMTMEGEMTFESGTATVASADQVSINFSTIFTSAPFVTANAFDSDNNSQANVNAYIISVSTTGVTIGFSASFTGEVHYHAIQSAS